MKKWQFLGLQTCFLFLLVAGFLFFGAKSAQALSGGDFNASRIIDDGIFFNSGTMGTTEIQNFLNAKVPTCDTNGTQPSGHAGYATRADWGNANGAPPPYTCLKNYTQSFSSMGADSYCGGISGGNKSAANIIYDVSRACGVNPQSLIVLLQKEESLITDDWPWPIQYKIATGYGCPDTAPCDAQYYGFFNQVYNAAHQFKRYIAQPNVFNYAAGRISFILYNPNSGCGGSNVGIQNGATAALYNYTPYQPNAAALNNLYGSGDSCSAYGNRNFWRLFNDWFGPTTGDGYILALNPDDNSQWVIYRGIKQYVPSADIKDAWGLPSQPTTMTGSYLATIPEGPHLGRMFHLIGDPTLYFADGGKKYRVPSVAMRDTWGFNGQVESFVSAGLWSVPQDGGTLSYSVKKASDPALYMIDGLNGSNAMVLRQYSNPDVFHAWEGDGAGITTVSDTYFDSIDNAVGAPLTGFTAKSASDPSQYQVVAGQKLYLSGSVAPLYNQNYETVSTATISRLITSSPVTQFVRANGDPHVYLIDSGTRHYVPSGSFISAWGGATVNIVDNGFLNLMSEDTAHQANSYLANVSGQYYLVDGRAWTVPSGLKTAYAGAGTPFAASSNLVALLPSAGPATAYVKGAGSPSVYLLDSGSKRHITSASAYALWNGNQNPTTVSDYALAQFNDSGDISNNYVTDGTTTAVVDNNVYYSASAGVATDWGLGNPTTIAASTLSSLTSGGALSNKVRSGSAYYLMKYGRSHVTFNANLANIWGINTSGTSLSTNLVNSVAADVPLTIFVRSTDASDHRIFAADASNKLYTFNSVQQVQNYGYISGSMLQLSPTDINAMTITDAQNIFQRGSSSDYAVLDGGSKRSFNSDTVQTAWLATGNQTAVSDYLWNFIPNGAQVGNLIKASAPNVYTIESGQKRWILSQASYQSYVASSGSYVLVSDQLAYLIPNGPNIP